MGESIHVLRVPEGYRHMSNIDSLQYNSAL